jgi:hypothetical protein
MLGRVNAVQGLAEIRAAWHGRLRPAVRRALVASLLLTLVGVALLGREGTSAMRLAAFGLLGAFVAIVFGQCWWQRSRSQAATLEVTSIVKHLDRSLATRLGRAIDLLERTQLNVPHVSVELAELHLERLITRVPLTAIEGLAATRATKVGLFSMLVMTASLGFALFAPLRLGEGFDVLLARDNVAPLSMHFAELEPVSVQPPAYLHGSPDHIEFDASSAEPRGSLVVVHAVPRRTGRRLVLTDGTREVPFVGDGRGGMTARYVLEDAVRLRVAARFGRVLVFQESELSLDAIADHAPEVELEGAPRRVSVGDVTEVEFRYRVTDDHGIRQVDLVLRTGSREERRLLVRFDSEINEHVGAYLLDAEDAFIQGSYGSVEAFVAARDDNTLDGVSWGQSAVITIDKPSLGRVQVRRRDAYQRLRNQLVDWLAATTSSPKATAHLTELKAQTLALLADDTLAIPIQAGVQKAMRSFLRAQRDKLLRAERDGNPPTKVLEEVVLSVDAAIEAIGHRDAEHVARLLADVAVEIESGAKAALSGEQRDQGMARVKSAHVTLATGAAELKRLGPLGADLGEVAQAGWSRIDNAIENDDLDNIKRAAGFLAERLRRPLPSFVGGGRAGVESLRRSSGRAAGPRASEADAHLERVIVEMMQLAREHAAEIEAVDRIVGDAEKSLGSDGMRTAAKQHANDLRRIVEGLPALGAEPSSMRASLALAKELVRGAAESLEHLQLVGAHAGLQKADAALMEAELLREPWHTDFGPQALRELRNQLAEHRAWVKTLLDEMRQSALLQSRDMLRRAGSHEHDMAERANRLAQRESKSDGVLPEDMRTDLEQASRLMRQAADKLDSGQGRGALEQQRLAQNLLERNAPDSDKHGSEASPRASQDGRNATNREPARGGKIVSTSDVESREAFRRRVQQGLSREVTPEISPSVRRYAEGLLK